MIREREATMTYKKLSLTEQVLLRPDTYIGSIVAQQEYLWIFNEHKNCFEHTKLQYVPGLFKIFGNSIDYM